MSNSTNVSYSKYIINSNIAGTVQQNEASVDNNTGVEGARRAAGAAKNSNARGNSSIGGVISNGGGEGGRQQRLHEGEISMEVRELSRQAVERVKEKLEPEVFQFFRDASKQYIGGGTSSEEFS